MLIADWQRVSHRLLAALEEEIGGHELSAAESSVLACFADAEQPSVRELADATALRPSTLTGVLDRLERRKLVARRPNPTDRRSTLIVPTARGRDAADRVAEAFERVAARVPRKAAADAERILGVLDDALAEPSDARAAVRRQFR